MVPVACCWWVSLARYRPVCPLDLIPRQATALQKIPVETKGSIFSFSVLAFDCSAAGDFKLDELDGRTIWNQSRPYQNLNAVALTVRYHFLDI